MSAFLVQGALVVTALTAYPSSGDRGLIKPLAIERQAQVEAAIDKGPIIELIVRCPTGTAILSFSKLERRYCTGRNRCSPSITTALQRSCTPAE